MHFNSTLAIYRPYGTSNGGLDARKEPFSPVCFRDCCHHFQTVNRSDFRPPDPRGIDEHTLVPALELENRIFARRPFVSMFSCACVTFEKWRPAWLFGSCPLDSGLSLCGHLQQPPPPPPPASSSQCVYLLRTIDSRLACD